MILSRDNRASGWGCSISSASLSPLVLLERESERGRCRCACTIAMQFSCKRRKKGETHIAGVVSWSRTLEVVADATLTFFQKGSARGSYIFYLSGNKCDFVFNAAIHTATRALLRAAESARKREQYPPPAPHTYSPRASALFRNSSHRAEKIINIVCVAREHRFCHTH